MKEENPEQVAALQAELSRVQSDAEELRSMLEANQADFRNFKRRIEAEQQAARFKANQDLLKRLLPLLDDLWRGLANRDPRDSWAQGMVHIQRKFEQTLENEGVQQIEALGKPFDPTQHEAVAEVDRSDLPAGHVAEITLPGYRLGENLLRPAQVVVSRKPARPAEGAPQRELQQRRPAQFQRPYTYDIWQRGGNRWPRY